MIKYNLYCKDCSFTFDSWFASSKEYEKIKKLKYLSCNVCHSSNLEKSIMSPNLLNTKKDKRINLKKDKKYISVKNKIKEYQKFIKNNFDYVGENFAYEARSIHYENTKNKNNKKGIYGNASQKEINELSEEGINAEIIPWIKEEEN
tara:strand:- start:1019 stop:1459 length:441 start_codon:yes stop_codon:yes gene_type:complete